MAIEGPLRELGIHDVFQLLDLSRKTGVLRVSSELREDEGVVLFDSGRVVQATIRQPTSRAVSVDRARGARQLERRRSSNGAITQALERSRSSRASCSS